MCGIAGIIAKNSSSYSGRMDKMRASLRHRGPDESAQHIFSGGILGHTRLSIVDLTTGKQPMLSRTGKVGVVFNGEIYGYESIKQSLPGYPFKTTSDTEVLLALYERYGTEMPMHLKGMFAFAIWDEEKELLFAARDRFGEKPFYYAFGNNGEFIFASEIKAILQTGLVAPKLSRESIAHYLRYLYVDPTRTVYSNVYTLAPGHALTLKGGSLDTKKYWTMPIARSEASLDEATETFKALFEASVKKQLVADVPVGAFLSGGLDSSTVVAVASAFQTPLKTFSFAFEGSTNELAYAREIADKYHTDHHELYDDTFEIATLLQEMQGVYDEPFADSSNIPTYLISKLASKHVKVALTGDGADELLGGYAGYASLLHVPMMNEASFWKRSLLGCLATIGSKLGLGHKDGYWNRAKAYEYSRGGLSVIEARARQNRFFSEEDLRHLMPEAPFAPIISHPSDRSLTVDDAMRFDLEQSMPGDILVKIDRAAMANSLELRAPFLDADFSAYCLSLPYRLKISDSQDKIILRKAYGEAWTESIRGRKKQGFGAPVHKWLRQPALIRLKKEYLCDPTRKIFEVLSFDACQRYAEKDTYQAWILLVLSVWMEQHAYATE